MKLPRNLSGRELARALGKVGYQVTRQTGSHLRLTRNVEGGGQHHLTVPNHDPLAVGTLNAVLADTAQHLGLTRGELMELLFGQ